MDSILVIDSGNSFLKWAYFENDECVANENISNQHIEQLSDNWKTIQQPGKIIVSHVSGETMRERLKMQMGIWGTKPLWVSAQPKQCGVTNCYDSPVQLGSDRWAAIIAAWNKCLTSCLVVNIGTAMTVDAVSNDGNFLGGFILPGPHLMFDSIRSNTSIKLEHKTTYRFDMFPVNTAHALYSGVVSSLLGSIERMAGLFERQQGYAVQNCLISGGGAPVILPYIDFKHMFVKNLVLDGLLLIAKQMPLDQTM